MDHETPAEDLGLNSEKVLRFSVARHDHHCLGIFCCPRETTLKQPIYDTDHKDCTVVLGRRDNEFHPLVRTEDYIAFGLKHCIGVSVEDVNR